MIIFRLLQGPFVLLLKEMKHAVVLDKSQLACWYASNDGGSSCLNSPHEKTVIVQSDMSDLLRRLFALHV